MIIMKMNLYHCSYKRLSLDEIECGKSEDGYVYHVGDVYSALEVGVLKMDMYGNDVTYLHKHQVEVNEEDIYHCSYDAGGFDDWLDVIETALKENRSYKAIAYRNQYELGTGDSYIILDKSILKNVQVMVMKREKVENILDDFENGCLWNGFVNKKTKYSP